MIEMLKITMNGMQSQRLNNYTSKKKYIDTLIGNKAIISYKWRKKTHQWQNIQWRKYNNNIISI